MRRNPSLRVSCARLCASLCVEASEKTVFERGKENEKKAFKNEKKSQVRQTTRRSRRPRRRGFWEAPTGGHRNPRYVESTRGFLFRLATTKVTTPRTFLFPHVSLLMKLHFVAISLAGLVLGAQAGAVDLTANTFDSEVLESGKAAFVKFFAPWYVPGNPAARAFRQTRPHAASFPERFPMKRSKG